MPLYRTLWPLAVTNKPTIPEGIVSRLEGISQSGLRALLERGAIQEIAAPPLAALPNWQARGRKLQTLDVFTLADVYEIDAKQAARTLKLGVAVVERWQREAAELLGIDKPPGAPTG